MIIRGVIPGIPETQFNQPFLQGPAADTEFGESTEHIGEQGNNACLHGFPRFADVSQ
jgi:hypothetical protein